MPAYISFIIIGVICATIIFVLINYYFFHKHYHYVCPKCSTSFKPTYLRNFLALNNGNTRLMNCPTCNHKELVKIVKDEP